MKEEIKKIIEKSFEEAKKQENWPSLDMPEIEVTYPKDEVFGDYTTNIAMVLAKELKISPLKAAQAIQEKIKADFISEAKIAAPGYINITLDKKYFQDSVSNIVKLGKKFGESEIGEKKKVLVEFISCNPTGPIHLGNGRGGPLGDSLSRVLEKVGYKAEREFYVNDWGNQVEILGHSVLKDEEAQYRGDYVEDLASKMDKNLKSPLEIGNWAAHIILSQYIKPVCKKLGINFNNWFSEKDLQTKGEVDKILEFLREKRLTYEKDGALWYKSTQFGDDKDRVLIKSDGRKTYLATDFAYHKNKISRGFDKLINIMGADHHKEVQVVNTFVEEVLGEKNKTSTILTQIVRVIKDGQEVKMSKRKGVYFALDDLIEEAGKDAVRFIFLSYSPQNHINFDINLAKEQSEKNPVFYVQYAHARISSILKRAKVMNYKFDEGNVQLLTHEKEMGLMREITKFPEMLQEIAESYEVHKLPFYAIRLADKFHSFYNACKILDEKNSEMTRARLNLVSAVKIVLAETLNLMGIEAPEKM